MESTPSSPFIYHHFLSEQESKLLSQLYSQLELPFHHSEDANIDIQDCNADKTIVLDEHSNPIQVFSPLLFSITIAYPH